jgi:hypothetical protein
MTASPTGARRTLAEVRPLPDPFDVLQQSLGPALAANTPGSSVDHVLIALPSFSVSESILSHYGDRIPSLEHRYLPSVLIAGRIPSCEMVYVSSRRPEPAVLDYHTSLIPPDRRATARIRVLEVDDGTSRSVAAKILADPAIAADLRAVVAGRPALIEPWNVTEVEVDLALALGIPVNGTRPDLRPLGFKSAGRRLMADAGVPVPDGQEDVRTVDDVVAAVVDLRRRRPDLRSVVVKHDDSGAGDGNVVLDLDAPSEDPDGERLRAQLSALPDWYLDDLTRGGVVEERIAGTRFSSPSAQVDIRPDGTVRVMATHEQVLGGPSDQVYLGCRFPADPAYAAVLAEHAAAIGSALAARGVIGRFGVDFVVATDDDRTWRVFAIEINLRKGGTTHPYAVLRNLVPGAYDPAAGRWVAEDGTERAYSATDNLVDPAWTGRSPAAVIDAVREAGLEFSHATGTGVVLHMLSGLAIDGRFGLTAIGRTSDEAQYLHAQVQQVMTEMA